MILQIGQLADLEVEADILSQDMVNVREGDPVQIYGAPFADLDGGAVSGIVHRISPLGFTKISSLGVEQQRVQIVIRFTDDARQLVQQRGVGVQYRVRVRIVTESKDEALVVPRSALFRDSQGQWQLYVVRGGRARQQPITVGLINDELAEITDGVSAGESVVLAPENSLRHNSRVRFKQ